MTEFKDYKNKLLYLPSFNDPECPAGQTPSGTAASYDLADKLMNPDRKSHYNDIIGPRRLFKDNTQITKNRLLRMAINLDALQCVDSGGGGGGLLKYYVENSYPDIYTFDEIITQYYSDYSLYPDSTKEQQLFDYIMSNYVIGSDLTYSQNGFGLFQEAIFRSNNSFQNSVHIDKIKSEVKSSTSEETRNKKEITLINQSRTGFAYRRKATIPGANGIYKHFIEIYSSVTLEFNATYCYEI